MRAARSVHRRFGVVLVGPVLAGEGPSVTLVSYVRRMGPRTLFPELSRRRREIRERTTLTLAQVGRLTRLRKDVIGAYERGEILAEETAEFLNHVYAKLRELGAITMAGK